MNTRRGHDGSRQLRNTQRAPGFVLRLFALVAVLSLLAQWAPVTRALGVEAGDLIGALGTLLAVNLVAFTIFHLQGDQGIAYRLAALVEAFALLGGTMWLIYRSGRGDGFMWLVYFAAATINGGVTEYRRPLAVLYGLFPLGLALAFGLLKGDWAAAGLCVVAGAFGLLVLETRMRTSLRLEKAIEEREQALVELAELRVRDERVRIARDLHDGLGADLAAMAWRARRIQTELSRSDDRAAGELAGITQRATQGIDELRTVVWALRSPSRPWQEIVAYLRQRLGELCAGRVELQLECLTIHDPEVPGEVAAHMVRIVQEAVRNALRHGKPTRIAVRLALESPLLIEVEDDGGGLPDDALERSEGGLANLRARARELGGAFTPASSDGKTRLRFELPAQWNELGDRAG